MLLVRERFPEIYERTYKFLNVLDYLNLRLTGRFAATFDSILTSWVTDNRNPNDIRYDEALMQGQRHRRGQVPRDRILHDGAGRGQVRRRRGLGPVDPTSRSSPARSTTPPPPSARARSPTSSRTCISAPRHGSPRTCRSRRPTLASSLASVPCAVPDRYLLTALQATAGGNLNFLRDNILYHEDELLQEANVPDVFKIMDQIAARVPAGSNGVIYTPWIWGERAPVEDRDLRAGLYNISLNNTREDIIRAFLEGVAFNTRWLMKPVEKFMGRTRGADQPGRRRRQLRRLVPDLRGRA